MKSTLEKRIIIFALCMLSLTIIVNTAINIDGYRRDYRDSIILRSNNLAEEMQLSIEKVLGFGMDIEGLVGIDERCRQLVEGDPEITYCAIESRNGALIHGYAESGEIPSDVSSVSRLEESVTIVDYAGRGRYYDIYHPVYFPDGELAGRVRIGFPQQVLIDRSLGMFQRSLLVLGVALLAAILMIVFYVKRDVVNPLRRLGGVATKIASGEFSVDVPVMPTDELAELAASLEEMARSLQDRELKIRQSYSELEISNNQLRDSYTRLENVSNELGRSREMYRSLMEDAGDAILVSDADNRLLLVNKAAEALFAVSRNQVEEKQIEVFLDLVQAEGAQSFPGQLQNVLHGQPLETELVFTRPSDKVNLVGWIKCSPVVDQDGKRIVQTTVRDITAEKKVKENLEKSAHELERLNAMKDSFLGVASHELKTPLTVILGYTELLLGDMKSLVGDGALPMIEQISRSAERLSRIVRDMVDVSLLDNQNISIRCRNVSLNGIIASVAEEMQFFVQKRKQSLHMDLDQDISGLWCDEERISQVMSNLINNAIKFTPDGGAVHVQSRKVFSTRPTGMKQAGETVEVEPISPQATPYVEIRVSDTGIGISEIDQIHIFDKFYEVGDIEEHFTAQSAFKGKGTGLGLTIAKGFVDLHDGELWVESPGYDANKCPGSTFVVLLPLRQERAEFGSDVTIQ